MFACVVLFFLIYTDINVDMVYGGQRLKNYPITA